MDIDALEKIVADAIKPYENIVDYVVQEWDERIDFIAKKPNGEGVVEYIPFAEISASRVKETCERLSAVTKGMEVSLVNKLSPPIRISKVEL